MSDQPFEAMPAASFVPARTVSARALIPTAGFWFAMFAASALGTNIGDFWADDLGLGLPVSFATLAVFCALMIWGDRENGGRTEIFYWLGIVCLRAVATNVGDFFTHTLHLDYVLAAVVLGAVTLVLGYLTLQAPGGVSPKIDLRYWVTMLVGGVFGTIAGDLVSHSIGLFLAAVTLVVLLLVVIRVRNLAAPTALVGYWCVVLAERAAGTPMGDWLAKGRGVGLGLPMAMVLTASVLLAALWWRAGTGTKTDARAGMGAAARVLLPALRLALFVLSVIGCLFMTEIYLVQRPGDPSFVLSYAIGLAVNAIYLGAQELAYLGSTRTGRLLSLWYEVRRQDFDRWLEGREAALRERVR